MTLSNAAVVGSKLQLTQGVLAQGSVSNASFPKSLESYEVTFNVTFDGVPGVASKKLFSYGPLFVQWNTGNTVTVNNGSGVTSTSVTSPLITAAATTKKYKVVARRVYFSTTALSTFELFVDGVRCIITTGDAIANLDVTTGPTLVLGGDTYTCVVTYDDLMMSRTVDSSLRKAPGSSVLLSSLPQKTGTTTEPNMWKMDAYTGTVPNYYAVDQVSALNMLYKTDTSGGDVWLGEWFNNPDQLTNAANYGTGTSTAFQGVTVVNGEVSIPAESVANTRNVLLADIDQGVFTSVWDGYGAWSVQARVKTNASGNSGTYSVFWVGDSYAGSSGGNRIQISVAPASSAVYITTEGLGLGDRVLVIPNSYLTTLGAAGTPNNGNYHTYRLARKRYTAGTNSTDPRNLFQLWYDGFEVNLQLGQNGVVIANGDTFLQNPKIVAASAYLRLGSNLRQGTAQAVTVDYVFFKNGITNLGTPVTSVPNHVGGYFETRYGSANYTISNYSKTGITRGSAGTGSGVLITGVIKPLTNFSTATGGSIGTVAGDPMTAPFTCGVATSVNSIANMVELLTVGDPNTPGAYVSVWVWRGGRILMFNGTSYTETLNAVVSGTEFVIGVHLTATEPQLYINSVGDP
eukprot:jgi/Mesvir1/19803/Mv13095-RA.1